MMLDQLPKLTMVFRRAAHNRDAGEAAIQKLVDELSSRAPDVGPATDLAAGARDAQNCTVATVGALPTIAQNGHVFVEPGRQWIWVGHGDRLENVAQHTPFIELPPDLSHFRFAINTPVPEDLQERWGHIAGLALAQPLVKSSVFGPR